MNYYGVRYSKECNPKELWVTYFTSSKYVKNYVALYGNPDLVEIRKTFNNSSDARKWEHKVLKRINAVTRQDFLNKTDNIAIKSDIAWNKGLTKETHPGIKRGAEKQKGRCKETYPSLARTAEKLQGRTKETHPGLAIMANKKRGVTKEVNPNLASKKKGVTKEVNPNLASKKKGKNKHTDSSLASSSEKLAKLWEITESTGEKYIVKGIGEWSRAHGFLPSSVSNWARNKKSFNGYFVKKLN
jgi:hypothetical protein